MDATCRVLDQNNEAELLEKGKPHLSYASSDGEENFKTIEFLVHGIDKRCALPEMQAARTLISACDQAYYLAIVVASAPDIHSYGVSIIDYVTYQSSACDVISRHVVAVMHSGQ